QRLLPGDELEVGAVRLAVMNGPRRQGGIGADGVIGLAVALAIAGFGLANYLHLRTSVLPFARSTTVRAPKPAPSAGDGSEPAPPNPASLADGMRAPAEPAAATSVDEEGWLKILNRYRAMAGLAAVRDDAALSAGGFAHARYLVKNSAALIKS